MWLCAVVCACTVTAVSAMSIPVLYTKGTHYEVGYDMGKTFVRQIRTYFDTSTELKDKLIPWSQTERGQQICNGYLAAINESYPQYVEQLQGTADGSGLSFNQMFVNMMRRELLAQLDSQSLEVDACTDIHADQSAFRAFGHNEDGDTIMDGLCYMVSAEIINDRPRGKLQVPSESFTSFVYPGSLGGNAFGFNSHGLMISMNALYPKLCLPGKLGHYFLARAAFSARTPQEVFSILESEGFGSAYGMSVNVGYVHSQSMFNIEVAPWKGQPRSLQDVKQINASGNDTGTYFHVNMYRRINIPEDPDRIISSQHRTARIQDLPVSNNKSQLLAVLGDRGDAAWPIYRTNEKDGSSTLATGYFDLMKWTLDVYEGNPAKSTPLHTFHIPTVPPV